MYSKTDSESYEEIRASLIENQKQRSKYGKKLTRLESQSYELKKEIEDMERKFLISQLPKCIGKYYLRGATLFHITSIDVGQFVRAKSICKDRMAHREEDSFLFTYEWQEIAEETYVSVLLAVGAVKAAKKSFTDLWNAKPYNK